MVPLAPHVAVIASPDQLRRYPDAALGSAHAALDSVINTEAPTDVGNVSAARVRRKRRHAGDDPKSRKARQGVDDLFGKTVAKVPNLTRSQIAEREHHETRLRKQGRLALTRRVHVCWPSGTAIDAGDSRNEPIASLRDRLECPAAVAYRRPTRGASRQSIG